MEPLLLPATADFLSLLRDETLHLAMLMASPEGIVVVNNNAEVVLVAGHAERLFGYEPVEIYGSQVSTLFERPEDYEKLQAELADAKTVSNHYLTAITNAREVFPVQVSASLLVDRIGEHIATVLYIRDHSDVQAIEDTLRKNNAQLNELVDQLGHVASHDQLTGLLNRASAIDAAEKELLRTYGSKPMSVAVMDLDHFKRVNDSYGHLVGDEVLSTLAGVLQKTTRGPDIIGRFGGEEFVAFLPNANLEAGGIFGERIRDAIEQTEVWIENELKISVTISVGVASIPGCAGNVRDAIRVADTRLFQAKIRRNCVVSRDEFRMRQAA